MNVEPTLFAALTAGLLTSLHCTGMCGPLTCSLFAKCGKSHIPSTAYQASRVLSYSVLGGLLGWVGEPVAGFFQQMTLLPWIFAVVFLVFAFGIEQRIAPPAFAARWFAQLKERRGGALSMGAILGLATPLLPCGPLYLMFGVALVAGSFFKGAGLMAAFAAGTLPVYWLAQSQFTRLQARFSPVTVQWVRQGLALVSAGLLIWRATANGGLGLASPHSCCH